MGVPFRGGRFQPLPPRDFVPGGKREGVENEKWYRAFVLIWSDLSHPVSPRYVTAPARLHYIPLIPVTWSNNVLCLLAASETKSRPGSLIQKGPHLDGRKIPTELNPKQYFNNARSSWLGRQRGKTTRGKSLPLESIKTNALKLVDLGWVFFK